MNEPKERQLLFCLGYRCNVLKRGPARVCSMHSMWDSWKHYQILWVGFDEALATVRHVSIRAGTNLRNTTTAVQVNSNSVHYLKHEFVIINTHLDLRLGKLLIESQKWRRGTEVFAPRNSWSKKLVHKAPKTINQHDSRRRKIKGQRLVRITMQLITIGLKSRDVNYRSFRAGSDSRISVHARVHIQASCDDVTTGSAVRNFWPKSTAKL